LRDDLAVEVALKVRDTLAALVGALHVRREPTLRPFAESAVREPPKVLLWLELDPVTARVEQRGDPTLDLRTAIRQRLQWLNAEVMVMSHEKTWPKLDLTVRRMPDRVYEIRMIVMRDGSISRDDFGRGGVPLRRPSEVTSPSSAMRNFSGVSRTMPIASLPALAGMPFMTRRRDLPDAQVEGRGRAARVHH
jgi:hypothetical protein